jgi:hypothetical protein
MNAVREPRVADAAGGAQCHKWFPCDRTGELCGIEITKGVLQMSLTLTHQLSLRFFNLFCLGFAVL